MGGPPTIQAFPASQQLGAVIVRDEMPAGSENDNIVGRALPFGPGGGRRRDSAGWRDTDL